MSRAGLVLAVLALTAAPAWAHAPAPPAPKLTAKIVVTSELPLEARDLKWELVLTNEGKTPVRVCTLCGGSGGAWEGHHEECFAPDHWKSDRPSNEEFDKHIVTLQPGESVSLPASLGGFRGEKYTLHAAYQVRKEFAAKHKVWEGKAEAEPVIIRAVKPK